MDKKEKLYYSQAEIWDKTPEPYQIQVKTDILDLLPKDVGSILDIGCGDGFLTNALPEDIDVVGIDISTQALKHVKRKKLVGSITDLPFQDNSFDLVMANDVIEHLPNDLFKKGLQEIARVARKKIIITVPFKEDLRANIALCKNCGTQFHVNMHHRSFDEKTLQQLFPGKWKPISFRYSGDMIFDFPELLRELRNKTGEWTLWENAVCPNCGSNQQVSKSTNDDIFLRILDAAERGTWAKMSFVRDHICERSEAIVTYSCIPVEQQVVWPDNVIPADDEMDILEVDFSNPYQASLSGFYPWCFLSKFVHGTDAKPVPGNGLMIDKENKITLEYPVPISKYDTLKISLTSLKPTKVTVAITEAVTCRQNIIFSETMHEGHDVIECNVDMDYTASRYGQIIEIMIQGHTILHSALLVKKDGDDSKTKCMKIHVGHNLLVKKVDDIIFSWSCYSEIAGKIPWPVWFDALGVNYEADGLVLWRNAKHIAHENMLKITNIIFREYGGSIQSKASLVSPGNEIENEAYRTYIKSTTFWNKRRRRHVNRVLVLSHLFPHYDQPHLGPFVIEQVEALREYEGIDARVISGRPFWMQKWWNLPAIWKAYRIYQRELQNAKWEERKGVPVLYLPYCVGGWFRFHVHAAMYRKSVMEKIDEVWKTFKFDLVHAHTGYLDGLAGVSVAERFGVPVVITEHTGPFSNLAGRPIISGTTINALGRANRVWCVSHALQQQVCSYMPPETHDNIQVLYNGVSTSEFQPSDDRIPVIHELKLFSVTGFEPIKNPFLLIEAFKRVVEVLPNTKLGIVGYGQLEGQVKELIKKYGLENKVTLYGAQPRENVARLLRNECDIFVLSSKAETFGVVLIEAMSCGKPVVATKCGGPESIVTEPWIGQLCQEGDPKALADSIIDVAQNINKYNPQKIREFTIKNFDYARIASELAKQYQEV